MALARWQSTVTNNVGSIVPGASVEVRRSSDFALVSIFSDREGVTPKSNPFTADSNGFAAFHVAGGSYRIIVTASGLSRVYDYVGIGLAQETDNQQSFSADDEEVTTVEDDDKFPFFDDSAGNARKLITASNLLAQATGGVGGSPLVLRPRQAYFPGSNYASLGAYDNFDVISYANAVNTQARWVGAMPNNYDTDRGITAEVLYLASTGSGTLDFDAKLADIVGYDSAGNGGSWISRNSQSASISVINKATFTFTNAQLGPAIRAPRLPFIFYLSRDGGNDSNSGTAYVLNVTIFTTPAS